MGKKKYVSLAISFFSIVFVFFFFLRDNIVDLEDHLDDLSGEQQLLLLRNQWIKHQLFLHICKKQTVGATQKRA
jgi:hypothetical protein